MGKARDQNYFDDARIGDELPSLVKGPLTLVHLVRWSGASENWHRIHYDRSFAVEHDALPDVLVNGSFKQQFVMQLLKDWAGLEGWAWKAKFQFRAMDLVGSTLHVWARVQSKIPCEQYGLVELELGIRGAGEVESTRGSALVALPLKNGAPVPYPFVPPAVDPWAVGN
jgi:acyl dehydratase